MFKEIESQGMSNKAIRALPIFKYLNAEATNGYEVVDSYIGKKRAYDKEHAKKAMFMFYYEGKNGVEIGEEFDLEKELGWTTSYTIAYLRIGIIKNKDNQRGDLKGKVSADEAQRLIDELVEYIYE